MQIFIVRKKTREGTTAIAVPSLVIQQICYFYILNFFTACIIRSAVPCKFSALAATSSE